MPTARRYNFISIGVKKRIIKAVITIIIAVDKSVKAIIPAVATTGRRTFFSITEYLSLFDGLKVEIIFATYINKPIRTMSEV